MSSTDSQPTGSTPPAASTADTQSFVSRAQALLLNLGRAIDQLAVITGGDNETIRSWRISLEAARDALSHLPEVVVGFVGVTGAGKSSLVNSLLGDRIVPTSGLKSCTSTPIRVMYHDEEKHKAWFDYISTESWLEEIRHFLRALIEARGSISKLGEDGKEAWQRISVVYPALTKIPTQGLMAMSAEDILASDPVIARKLGNLFLFEAESAKFAETLQDYTLAGEGGPPLWPIIAQISIQCRAPVLKDGITFLDLPGVLDSNTARAAIAAEYLKTCDHIFVVAPIKRAVTDQVAQELLGDAFRAQLRMDGKYTTKHIALIASCCDDIECTEIVEELGLSDSSEWKSLSSQLQRVREQLEVVKAELDQLRTGEVKGARHAYDQSPLKRSGEALSPPLAKRPKLEYDSLPVKEPNFLHAAQERDMATSPDRSSTIGAAPSTSSPVTSRGTMAENEAWRSKLEAEERDLQIQCTRYCIAARNAWTRRELQDQFQCGLDDTKDAPGSEEAGTGDAVTVFTVSARECSRLQGKSLGLNATPICQTLEETGVPAVAALCRRFAEENLRGWRDRISDQLSTLAGQVQRWSQQNASGSRAAWNGPDANDLKSALPQKIALAISRVADETCATILSELDELAFCMRQAAVEAGQTIERDFAPKIAQDVTHHNTLKALLRRFGRWKGHDWNERLVAYLKDHFASRWDRVLGLHPLDGDAGKIHDAIAAVLSELEDVEPLTRIKQVTEARADAVVFAAKYARTAAIQCRAVISGRQQRISRRMSAAMEKAMRALYESACKLPGTGFRKLAIERIREYLARHAEGVYMDMVEAAIGALRATVEAALRDYTETLRRLGPRVVDLIMPTFDLGTANPHQKCLEDVAARMERIKHSVGRIESGLTPAA